jgi:hypothetical protein
MVADEFVSLDAVLKGTFKGVSLGAPDERSKALQTLYFAKGYRFEAQAQVRGYIAKALQQVRLVDRYVTIAVVQLLHVAPSDVRIQIWTEKAREPDFEDAVKAVRDGGRNIAVYYCGKEFHARFLIIDDRYWHLGHSLKDLGSSDAVIQTFEDVNAIQSLEDRLAHFVTN